MHEVLKELRALLEFERNRHGDYVLLDAPPASPSPLPFKGAPVPAGDPSAEPASARPAPPSKPENPSSAPDDDMANIDLFGNQIDPSQDATRPPWERIEALIPEESPLHAMTTLAEVERYTRETILTPIDEQRTKAVFGVGNPDADLLIIGEAPGAEEDRTGEPFVGRAGQLLNKILEAIELAREDVYIANILKSRPPNNRDPLAEEVEAHVPILYKQIALIQPKLILCVGKTSGNTLLNRRSSLGALRDKFHDYYGLPVLVTYHPAALLRNPQWKRPTWEDMKLLRTRYDQLVG